MKKNVLFFVINDILIRSVDFEILVGVLQNIEVKKTLLPLQNDDCDKNLSTEFYWNLHITEILNHLFFTVFYVSLDI